ncbi:MAG: hypothetical protein OXP69_12400 [Spirochaetaceae bacterium]|nr:hypothetical protein [Spirochaetaceae bacterium]
MTDDHRNVLFIIADDWSPPALFDMDSDPTESHNLVDRPEMTRVAAGMRAKLLAFRTATRDPWLEVSFQEGEVAQFKPF